MGTVRIVAFDESGSFESPDRNTRLVGGIVFQKKGVADSDTFINNLNQEIEIFFKDVIAKYNTLLSDNGIKYVQGRNDYTVFVSYPESLHTKWNETYFYMDSSLSSKAVEDSTAIVDAINLLNKFQPFNTYINCETLKFIKSKNIGMDAYIYPFRDNENIVEEISSNITSSEVGANLYVRMASLMLSNCIFYHFDDSPEDYYLKLARRSLPRNNHTAGELSNQAAADGHYYHITDQGIYKNILSSEIYEQDLDSSYAKANYHFGVEKIDYKHASGKMPLYYLADTVCSILQFYVNSSVAANKNIGKREAVDIYEALKKQMGSNTNIQIRYYDKADLMFRRMYKYAVSADLARMYELEYLMHKNGLKGELLRTTPDETAQRQRKDFELAGYYYDVLVPQLENYVGQLTKNDNYKSRVLDRFSEYLDYTEGFMGKRDEFAYDKGLYIINKLYNISQMLVDENRVNPRTGETLFRLNSIRLRALNHKGTVKGLIPVVEECEKYRKYVNPFDYIDYKISSSQLYFNSFEFDKAKDMFLKDVYPKMFDSISDKQSDEKSENLRSAVEQLEQAISNLTGDEGNPRITVSGKIFSSLGQAYAFLGEKKISENWFLSSLEKWGDNAGNYNITLSYLLHLYIDNKDRESYERYVKQYYGYFGDDFIDLETRAGQLEALRRSYEQGGFIRYAFFVYIKAFYTFYLDTDMDILDDIIKLVNTLERKMDIKNDPWQTIYKYLYFIYRYKNNKKKMKRYGEKVFEFVSGDATISIMQLYFEIVMYQDVEEPMDISMKDFVDKSRVEGISDYIDEFKCLDGIKDMSLMEAKELLESKLTFMYR
ncbi:hypothetical protein SAMN02910369_02234 [Lachnospiraceae bacterium NE2001]|nr:hypothetical protein SAMN02910369_02234 [Lachnospiraceae bacterium NE2001]